MIKRVESKTTRVRPAITQFHSYLIPRIAFHCPPPLPPPSCTRESERLIAARATFICLIQYFLPIHLSTPFARSLIFRGRRERGGRGGGRVYKVSRGKRVGLTVCLRGGRDPPRFLPRSSRGQQPLGGWWIEIEGGGEGGKEGSTRSPRQ